LGVGFVAGFGVLSGGGAMSVEPRLLGTRSSGSVVVVGVDSVGVVSVGVVSVGVVSVVVGVDSVVVGVGAVSVVVVQAEPSGGHWTSLAVPAPADASAARRQTVSRPRGRALRTPGKINDTVRRCVAPS
jgi:hypothetical protein